MDATQAPVRKLTRTQLGYRLGGEARWPNAYLRFRENGHLPGMSLHDLIKQPPQMPSRTRALLCVPPCMAATWTAATPAEAQIEQTAKNGCTSPEAYGGSLTSEPFIAHASVQGNVTFQGWFEVESIAPLSHDEVILEYSLDPGQLPRDWIEFGRLTEQSTPPTTGA